MRTTTVTNDAAGLNVEAQEFRTERIVDPHIDGGGGRAHLCEDVIADTYVDEVEAQQGGAVAAFHNAWNC